MPSVRGDAGNLPTRDDDHDPKPVCRKLLKELFPVIDGGPGIGPPAPWGRNCGWKALGVKHCHYFNTNPPEGCNSVPACRTNKSGNTCKIDDNTILLFIE